jgi:hypothetical protein
MKLYSGYHRYSSGLEISAVVYISASLFVGLYFAVTQIRLVLVCYLWNMTLSQYVIKSRRFILTVIKLILSNTTVYLDEGGRVGYMFRPRYETIFRPFVV